MGRAACATCFIFRWHDCTVSHSSTGCLQKANPADLPSRVEGKEERAFYWRIKAKPRSFLSPSIPTDSEKLIETRAYLRI